MKKLYKKLSKAGYFTIILNLFLLSNSLSAQTYLTVGTGTSSNSSTGYPAPYGNWYTGAKHQMIILASELQALGGSAGTINSLAFDVATAQGVALDGFTIKIGTTTATSVSNTWETGLTTVYSVSAYTETAGWNTHTFTTPFVWDGSSNIIIETCFDKYQGSSNYTSNAHMYYSTVGFTASHYYRSDGGGVCASTSTSGTSTNRPNMRLGITTTSNDLGANQWLYPQNGTSVNSSMPIILKVYNYGSAAQSNFTIKYSIDNGSSWISQVINSSLAAHTSSNYTFTAHANMSTPGDYNCIAVVKNSGDTITSNDTLRKTIHICGGSYSGSYTLGNSSNADFSSFNDFSTAINLCGITGPLTILVDSGTYDEQVVFNNISGASSTNTITITSANGNPDDVIINNTATNTNDNYTLKLDGADYFTIKNITLKANSPTYATVVDITNGSDHNILYNNKIISNSSNSYSKAIQTSSSNSDFNLIRKNNISGGYYGIYLNGDNASYRQQQNNIDSNEIANFYSYGIYSRYQNTVSITNNYIHDGSGNNLYGVSAYYTFDNFNISKNKIILNASNYSYGCYLYRCNYYSNNPTAAGLVDNNMISITSGSGTNYGIYTYYSDYISYYYNSVLISGGNTNSRALYQAYNTSGNTHGESFKNNIFANSSGGYAAYFTYINHISSLDYNDYYTTGSNFVYWNGNKNNLTSLQSASGKDPNSISLDPLFLSNEDLHTYSAAMSNKGISVSSVTTDFDGDIRSTSTPDIGADEYTPIANDVSIIEWVSPQSGINPSNSVIIKVKIQNLGTNTQSNIPVKYSIDGGQTYTTETINSTLNSLDTLVYTFSTTADFSSFGSYSCIAYTNLASDQNNNNDSITYDVFSCTTLNGLYTLGSDTSNDFNSFSSLNNALNSCGIMGPVTILVDSGTYNEQVVFNNISGASSTNTITIMSSSGNPDDVIINNTATNNNDNYTLKLDGADYFTIKNITLKANSPTYATVVDITNGSDHNILYNNKIISNSSNSYSKAIQTSSSNSDFNLIRKNNISGGYYGIYLNGDNASYRQQQNNIDSNEIANFYSYGIYSRYQNTVSITNNYIHDGSGNNLYGVSAYYTFDNFNISKNKIILNASNYSYGCYLYRCNYYSNNPTAAGLVDNNMISITSGSGTNYGIYTYYSDYISYYYNSVLISGGNTNSRALYQAYNTSGNTHGESFKNNIFANSSGGYAAYFTYINHISSLDYNDYYTTGSNFVYWNGNKNNLTSLQSASGKNAHSKSVNPLFLSNEDLHTYSAALSNKGISVSSVTNDFDGETRNISTPDIGADEYTAFAHDLCVKEIIHSLTNTCGSTSDSVFVVVLNNGTANQNPSLITLISSTPNGDTTIYGVSNPIPSTITDTIYIGQVNTGSYGNYTYEAYTSLNSDAYRNNDTLSYSFTIETPLAVDYISDFESNYGYWDLNNMSISSAHGNPGNGLFKNYYSGSQNGSANMNIKIGPTPNNANLVFDYKIINYSGGGATTLNSDSFFFMLSTDCGLTFDTIYTVDSSNHIPTTLWNHKIVPLNSYIGQNVQLYFNAHWASGDYYFSIDNIGIATPPSVDLGNDTNICVNTTITIGDSAVSGYNYQWKRNDTLLSSTSSIITADMDGEYSLIINSPLGTTYDTIQINYFTAPILSISNLSTSYCDNEMTTTLVGTPANGVFSGNGVSGSIFDPTTSGLGMQYISYSYTDTNSCSFTKTDSTIVYQAPSINITDDTSICAGELLILSADTAISPSNSYIWSNGASSFATVISNNITSYYSVTISNNNCSSIDSTLITINQLPILSINGLSSSYCNNDGNVLLTGNPANGVFSGTGIDSVGLFSPNLALIGYNTIIYSYTDSNQCSNIIMDSIIVNAVPTVNMSSDAEICKYDSTNIAIVFTGASPWNYAYEANGVQHYDTTSNNLYQKLLNPTSSTNYVITSVTDANGCSSIGHLDSLFVRVNSLPNINSSIDDTICFGDSSLISLDLSGAKPWTFNMYDGINYQIINTSDSAFHIFVSPTSASQYIFSNIIDSNTCSVSGDLDSTSVYVNSLPTAIVSNGSTICEGDSFQTAIYFTGESPWSYSFSTNNSTITNTTSNSFAQPYFSPSISTTYILSQITDGNSCTSVGNLDTLDIMVNPSPSVSISNGDTICFGDSSQVALLFTGTSPWNYTINTNSSSYIGNSTNILTPIYLGPSTTTNYILSAITDGNGCSSYGNLDSVFIKVNPLPSITLNGTSSICVGDSSNILALLSGSKPFEFTINGNLISNLNANTYSSFISPITSTQYMATHIQDSNGCVMNGNLDSIFITVNDLPGIQLSGTNTICMGDSSLLTASFTGKKPFDFVLNGNIISTINDSVYSSFLYPNASSWYKTTHIQDSNGCVMNGNLDSIFITVNQLPYVNIGNDTNICWTQNITFDAGPGFTSYLWNTGATSQTLYLDSLSFNTGPNIFYVTIIDTSACSNSDSIELIVDPCTGISMPVLTKEAILLYPNPNKGQFHIEINGLSEDKYSLSIVNSIGVKIYDYPISNNGQSNFSSDIHLRTLAKGLYFLRLESKNGIQIKKFVIN
jgi:hypothetical protein